MNLEDLKWHKFPVGSDGFICLVDVMGDDLSVVQAARVSYGDGTKQVSDDRTLIRYLMRHRHTTPFEMSELKFLVRVPMDTWRQWIRQRTACLAGDTQLVFSRKGNGKAYPLTIKQVYERFQPTENRHRPDKQGNPYRKRDRVKGLNLRCVDERTGEVKTTRIVDVWESGVKPVFKISMMSSNGILREIRTSKDHRFWTPLGWKSLSELSPGDEVYSISSREGTPEFRSGNIIYPNPERWADVVGWEGYYEVSTHGRVRRAVGGRGSRSFGRHKELTISNERYVTSLNRPGYQELVSVHREVLRAFEGGPPPDKNEACHVNGNPLDNRLENLRWGSSKDNGQDMVKHGRSTFLACQPRRVLSIEPDGEEMTYDIEVEGPWHNFSANDFVVHNSVNEYSTRYSKAIDSMAVTDPREWRLQSSNNKQGSDGFVIEDAAFLSPDGKDIDDHWGDRPLASDGMTPLDGNELSRREADLHRIARDVYEDRLRAGVAREQARKDLPLSTLTEAYWKIDLHNLLNFLSQRMDSHAQKEIRDYANVIGHSIVKPLFPLVWEAFEDYRLGAVTLTRLDVEMLRILPHRIASGPFAYACREEPFISHGWDKERCRERDECRAKLELLGFVF